MRNVEPLVIELRRKDLVKEFSKAVRFHLTEKEQDELVEDLLSHLDGPTKQVEGFAEIVAMLRENGGHLDATKTECWEMAKKDAERIPLNSRT